MMTLTNYANIRLIEILNWQDEGAELPFTPPMRGELFAVRSGMRPKLQRSAIEVRILKIAYQFFHFILGFLGGGTE